MHSASAPFCGQNLPVMATSGTRVSIWETWLAEVCNARQKTKSLKPTASTYFNMLCISGSDPGAATRMKLIINMVMGSVVASLSEGMAMAEKVGLDLEDVAEVLSLGSLRCPTIVHKSQGK